ncbi:pyrimidine reductase family protein [Lacisediminihabitans changchengi]|uniref:Pyrimidine reductase family protein n=1 Tax=Lacisediminihabitans changchengi TaxID=2787634 RepID=A0A934W3T1_9MICO|nr:pyrimidine reductase family protein [Lacisediminihabitans changchengi]MBK4348211.1 pyrimidine reductase family protein [Lacisediminihabitans changchengi]
MVRIDAVLPSPVADLDDEAIAAHYAAGSPWLRVNFVSSIDGAATADGLSAGLGGDADHRVFDILRRLCDMVLVASGTVKAEGYGPMVVDDESAAWRVAHGLQAQPVFAIVSGRLDLDPTSAIFTDAPVRPIVVTTGSSPMGPRAALAEVADVLICGESELDPAAMVQQLAFRGLGRIHCEGGPSLFGALLDADVVDELCLTLSPLLEAGDSGRIAHSATGDSRAMELAGVLHSDGTLLLRYTRAR